MNNFLNTCLYNKYLSALIAFILWGSWAYFINVGNSKYSGLVSGLSQGIASFAVTLGMVQSVTYFYNRIDGGFLKLIFPSVITTSLTCALLILIHHNVGTQHIFKTIFPALCIGFIFCLFTTYLLKKTNNKGIDND